MEQFPAPTLVFTQGDTAEIYVHNLLDVVQHSIGMVSFYLISLTAVPYLTQMPIPAS
jgi:FtsP/CotA-like multicopper oxidase with cupredoxin domain